MEDKQKNAQEMYMEFQMLDQRIKQVQSQLEMLANQLMELSATGSSLDEFDRLADEKEVFVPLSSGIFAKARMKKASELLVNVGANVVVTKDVSSTKKLIQNQIDEIKGMQQKMVAELEKMASRAGQLEMQLQSMMPQE